MCAPAWRFSRSTTSAIVAFSRIARAAAAASANTDSAEAPNGPSSSSRNWTGMSRRLASSPIGTGPAPPARASSVSARTAYGDLVVIESMRPSSCHHHRPMRPLSRFGPPLALMGVIFFFSAQPDLSTGLGTWDTILRKAAHMAEYGLLWLLWWRALGYRNAGAAAAITIAYGATDEFHQSFVEGRHGTPVDVLIDAAGVALAAAAVAARRRIRASRAR